MDDKPDYNLLSEIMRNANMGWWEADLQSESYVCSEYISKLLGLKEDGFISFEDFNKRILKEEQPHTTIHSFDNIQQTNEAVYLLNTTKGPVWMRSKICMQKNEGKGNSKVYGIAEVQDGPYMSSASQLLQQRELLLHNIYKNLPVGIELYNMQGVLTDLNDKELEMFHLQQKEDLLGINIFDNPIFPDEMKEKLRKCEDADFTFRYDFSKIGNYYNSQKKTGTMELVTKVTTLYDEHHTPINYLLINADKTEATIAYNKIQEFESFFKLIGNYAKVGYAHYNLLTQKGDAQHSWYINIGEKEETPLSDIIGVYNHIHPDDRHYMLDFLDNARKGTENKFNKEIRVLRENGSCSWTHINLLVKVYAPEQNSIELICINYDITRLKETEAMLIQAKEKAEESDRLKSAFLANMSHEIRTPLNAIVGFSKLVIDAECTNEKEQYAEIIERNSEILLNLFNDILDLSSLEADSLSFNIRPIKLIDICLQLEQQFCYKVKNGTKLILDDVDTELYVSGDWNRIIQIISNLLSNAAKFTPKGEIHFGYREKEDFVEFYVKDSGIGIPAERVATIFQRFGKINDFVQGIGLGLTLCRMLVEKMGGRIWLRSQEGKGSRFYFTLPLIRQ